MMWANTRQEVAADGEVMERHEDSEPSSRGAVEVAADGTIRKIELDDVGEHQAKSKVVRHEGTPTSEQNDETESESLIGSSGAAIIRQEKPASSKDAALTHPCSLISMRQHPNPHPHPDGSHEAAVMPSSDDPCAEINEKLTPEILNGHHLNRDPFNHEQVQVPDVENVIKSREEIHGREKDNGGKLRWWILTIFLVLCGILILGICCTRYSQDRQARLMLKELRDQERQQEFDDAAAAAKAISASHESAQKS